MLPCIYMTMKDKKRVELFLLPILQSRLLRSLDRERINLSESGEEPFVILRSILILSY